MNADAIIGLLIGFIFQNCCASNTAERNEQIMGWLGWSTENTYNIYPLSLLLRMGVGHDTPQIIAILTSKTTDHHKNIMIIKLKIW